VRESERERQRETESDRNRDRGRERDRPVEKRYLSVKALLTFFSSSRHLMVSLLPLKMHQKWIHKEQPHRQLELDHHDDEKFLISFFHRLETESMRRESEEAERSETERLTSRIRVAPYPT
jgi:hypothetical protein